jgi:hypothetical protein
MIERTTPREGMRIWTGRGGGVGEGVGVKDGKAVGVDEGLGEGVEVGTGVDVGVIDAVGVGDGVQVMIGTGKRPTSFETKYCSWFINQVFRPE